MAHWLSLPYSLHLVIYLQLFHVCNVTVNPSFSNMLLSVLTVCSVLASCIMGGSCGDSYFDTYNDR